MGINPEQRMYEFEAKCRAAGMRITNQRMQIFRELAEATDHPSVESLHSRLRGSQPNLSLDTVYRTLATLEEQGLIYKVQVSDDSFRYEPNMHPHHHIICTTCRKIVDFDWPSFDEETLPQEISHFGDVQEKFAILRGTCKECLTSK